MKKFFPRVAISLDFGSNSHSGDLSMMSLGYGLHQAWILCAMLGPVILIPDSVEASSTMLVALDLPCCISLVVYAFFLFLQGIGNQSLKPLFRSRPMVIAAGIAMFVGTFLRFVPSFMSLSSLAFDIVVGVATGFGSAVLLIAWGVRFARCNQTTIRVNSVIAFAIAFTLYAIVSSSIPYMLSATLVTALPLLELWILLRHPNFGVGKNTNKELFFPLPVRLGSFLVKFGIPVAVFCFSLGFLRVIALRPDEQDGTHLLISLILACMILIFLLLLTPRQEDGWTMNFRMVGLMMAVAVSVLCLGDPEGNQQLRMVVIVASYICFETFLWVFFSEFSQVFRLSPMLVFGIGRGCASVSTLVVNAIAVWATNNGDGWFATDVSFVLIIMVTLMVSFVFFPSRDEMESLLTPNALQESIESMRKAAEASYQEFGRDEETLQDGEMLQDVKALDGGSSATCADEDELDDASELGAGGGLLQAYDGVHAGEASLGGGADALMGNQEFKSAGHKNKFRAMCQVVATTYMLSAREQEVLFFLARGYNAALIQEKLYISEGTAKTHMRHIYRKLNVHTQQELIRVVESVKLD